MSAAPPAPGLWRRLWRELRARPLLLATAALLYPINAGLVALPPLVVQRMLDQAVGKHDVTLLGGLATVYLAALLAEFVTGFASEYLMSVLGQRALAVVRRDLFAHVDALDPAYFDHNPLGRTLSRLIGDVETLGELFTSGAITMIADGLVLVAVLAGMFHLSPQLATWSLVVVPPLVALTALCQRVAREAFRGIRHHIGRVNGFLVEHLGAMAVVQAFVQEARTEREFAQLNADYRDANRRAIWVDAALYAIVEAVATVAVAALIWYGAADMSAGAVSAGTLVAFIHAIRRFFVPIRDLSTKYTFLQSALAGAERISALFNEPIVLKDAPGAAPVAGFHMGLELRDVWFGYNAPTREEDFVLRGINLQVRRGERLALVGLTGSGKSSILKLLNRSYDVQRGAMLLDGADVRGLQLGGLRRRFATVLQETHLFAGTLMDNLTLFGRLAPERARHALVAVGLGDWLARLPGGEAAPVAPLGSNFSAGERQLLSLARALAYDPDIFLLDEATSNVDSLNEARIQAALEVVLAERTAVVVAHRLSTVQKLDRIVVLHGGRVVQEGSHATLMQQDGLYRRLVDLQLGHPA